MIRSWLALLEFDSERCVVHMRYGRMWFLTMMMIWAPFSMPIRIFLDLDT
jgi:hypothetical protein